MDEEVKGAEEEFDLSKEPLDDAFLAEDDFADDELGGELEEDADDEDTDSRYRDDM